MSNDEMIDLVLSKIYEEVTFDFKVRLQVILGVNDLKSAIRLKNDMESNGLIKRHNPKISRENIYEITGLGNEISRKGGWLKHLQNKKIQADRQKEDNRQKPTIILSENKISRLEATYKIVAIISSIGLLIIAGVTLYREHKYSMIEKQYLQVLVIKDSLIQNSYSQDSLLKVMEKEKSLLVLNIDSLTKTK